MTHVAPTSVGPVGGLPSAVRSHAFTLIEILVVISIFMILMGLTVGSVVRGPKLQRMIAAEQIISDCIRQARHTARTSGQPVILNLRKDARLVGGLVRKVLWNGVENWPTVKNPDPAPPQVTAPGRTGTGLMLPDAYMEDGTGGTLDTASGVNSRLLLPWPYTPDSSQPLTGSMRLWRGQTSPSSRPGLLLSVAVRPQVAGESGGVVVLPLAQVGEDKLPDDPDFASFDAAVMGLALIQSDLDADGGVHAKSTKTVAKSWEVVGWFGQEGSGRVEVSSIVNAPVDQITGHRTNLTIITDVHIGMTPLTDHTVIGDAESGPLTGGRWTEITLLVSSDRLVLYRDGRRVGEKAMGAVALPTITSERIYVGCSSMKMSTTSPAEELQVASGSQIDDVRLERLDDALAGTMPAGVKFDADHQITCHPDGRVEVGGIVSVNPDIILNSDSGEHATLTVNTAGAVSSKTEAAP